jgi:peptidoglycan-N-acetylglucosamine deacetylase
VRRPSATRSPRSSARGCLCAAAACTPRDVALTFDDGPGPYSTLALRILRLAHPRAHATFFLVGKELSLWPTIPARELQLGALGDHTWTHTDLLGLPDSAVTTELATTKAAIQRQTHARVDLFRPPYGATDSRIAADAARLGMIEVLWSVDTRDSEGARWNEIAANVARFVHGGSIVLMHENRGQTIQALKFRILPLLRRRDLVPVTVPQLLARDPPTLAQLRAGLRGCYAPGEPVPEAIAAPS